MLNKVKKMFYTESRAFDIYCLQFTVSWYRISYQNSGIEEKITGIVSKSISPVSPTTRFSNLSNQNHETIFSHVKKPFRPISASLCLHSSEFVHSRQTFRRDFFQVAGCVLWLKVYFRFKFDTLGNFPCLQRFTIL